jgi:hypothetical protein
MSPHKQKRRLNRSTVCWYLAGLVIVHLGVSVAVHFAGSAFRDPNFNNSAARLAVRCAEAPDRPLLLALGSSRTLMGLDAGLVNRTDKSLLVYNFSDLGAGPMLEQLFLRRILARGVRPSMVLLDIAPMSLASGLGVTSEEVRLDQSRLTWKEMRTVAGSYGFRGKPYGKWLKAHAIACVSKQEELHEALGIDTPLSPGLTFEGDPFGFAPYATPREDARVAGIRDHLARFGPQLKGSHVAAGPARAIRELVDLCRSAGLPFAVIYMPECSGLRKLYTPEFLAEFDRFVADLRREGDFELIDAREWVADAGFWDGHHLHYVGAEAFSARFAQEAVPVLRRQIEASGDQKERLAASGR